MGGSATIELTLHLADLRATLPPAPTTHNSKLREKPQNDLRVTLPPAHSTHQQLKEPIDLVWAMAENICYFVFPILLSILAFG